MFVESQFQNGARNEQPNKKSGCGCVRHGRGFDVNTSALAANIFFGIWEWNESNERDTRLLFSI